jgi:hypothetical protein
MTNYRNPRTGAIVALSLVLLAALLVTGAAAAQSTSAGSQAEPPAAYITINPQAGFPLDPFIVSLQGGGPEEASTLSQECAGYIPKSPAVTVDYKGKADLLKAFFYSDGDTVLVVQTPDGKYLCNDDTNALLLDPTVEIQKPAQGRYNVWVGSSIAKDLVPGFLVFTAHGNVSAGTLALKDLVKRPAQPELTPARARLVAAAKRVAEVRAALKSAKPAEPLKPGGGPLTADVTANGTLPAPEVSTSDTLCGGLVNEAPDYTFDWTGEARALGIMFEGDGDATLLVRTPDGSFACADDANGFGNVNPLVVVGKPAAGQYLVWVGRVDPSKPVTGKLTVASTGDLKPAILKKK